MVVVGTAAVVDGAKGMVVGIVVVVVGSAVKMVIYCKRISRSIFP